ncbi:hypothetical protein [Afipia clevelandensis]|uniref:Uncharacterized protein n=1 Tax=Afipia clevelandensis ATCC 49720 TaxID=883079 RepID=K8PAM1_9BRAD|nr:hypothetical protein [Afipia clevelandensis]EKS37794.1 hypothetical protein HMPREF9696_01744 [Afipia clevelandensis ATCC 49720]
MTRKFITDLFTGKEHQSFTSREELIRAITANGFAPDTVHEVEAPAICNDVTDDIAWGVVEFRRADGDDLTDLERDFVEQTIGIEAARSSMEAA